MHEHRTTERVQEGLTGKMMTSEGDICPLLAPYFASAEMASRAIEDAVSNPVHQENQDSIQEGQHNVHLDQRAHPRGTSTNNLVNQVSHGTVNGCAGVPSTDDSRS